MIPLYIKIFQHLCAKFNHEVVETNFDITDPQRTSDIISDYLYQDAPCMIARFGSTELTCFNNYRSVFEPNHSVLSYIKGEKSYWQWDENIINQMTEWSGFFPNTKENIIKFCQKLETDIHELDFLGSWVSEESKIKNLLKEIPTTPLRFLEPFYCDKPWTKELKGKRVLIVHPFAKLIEEQYNKKREYLFDNPFVLPEFQMSIVPAVQSLGGKVDGDFRDWFEALKWMEDEIDRHDYDVCLIGCGAYGFSLAAHVKRTGHKAIHLGGALQLLFGIKGNRWEDPNYGVKEWGIQYATYSNLMNKYWVKPDNLSKPANALKVENECYW